VSAIPSSALLALSGVGSLTSSALVSLSTAVMAGLSTQQIQNVTTRNVSALTSAQIVALTTAQYVALTSTQFRALSAAQVGVIQTEDLIAIETADIRALSTAGIAALTSAQIQALKTAQYAAFTSSQLRALSTLQVVAISTSALNSIESSQIGFLTPLALDLDGNRVRTISTVAGAVFDLDANGQAEQVGWLSASDAWLAFDRNANGIIDDGSELFGSGTTMPDGSKALAGYAALQVLDANNDGVIDSQDPDFTKLSVWVDANSNAKTDLGELRTLAQAGVQALSLGARPTAMIDQGNLIGLIGSYSSADGMTHEMADIWLSVKPLGPKVLDLSLFDHSLANAGALARIDFSGYSEGDTLKVSLSDVLSFGDTDLVGGLLSGTAGQGAAGQPSLRQMVISGQAQDTIQLVDAANWATTGTAVIGDSTYRVLSQGLAQLLVEDKVKIVAV